MIGNHGISASVAVSSQATVGELFAAGEMGLMKAFHCDELLVQVFQTRTEMGCRAGRDAAAYIKKLLQSKESINVMFAAAPSQNETLAELMKDTEIDWSRINAFHMDEYVGLAPEHPAGFCSYLNRTIFGLKDFRAIHLMNGNAVDPQEEADRYSRLLQENPLDVCILGIGENGHIAFNDPHAADFNDPQIVKIVKLDDRCRQQQVNDGGFGSVDQVPTHALTVTIPGLFKAKAMFCSVPAAAKADAVKRVIHGGISADCPATILRKHGYARMYVDADAGKYI